MLVEIANAEDRGRLFDLEERRLWQQRITSLPVFIFLWDALQYAELVRHHSTEFARNVIAFDAIVLIVFSILFIRNVKSRERRREKCIRSGYLDMYSSSWRSYILVLVIVCDILSAGIYAIDIGKF